MLAVYMRIVREATEEYVELWNIHLIRKQNNRPNSVSGQPEVLYEDPPYGVEKYGVPIDPEFAKKIEDSLPAFGKCFLPHVFVRRLPSFFVRHRPRLPRIFVRS